MTYSDNVNLDPSGEEQESVVYQIDPGILVRNRHGGRLNLDLAYRMQNLFYSKTDRSNRTTHFLDSNAELEVIQNKVFIDARATATRAFDARQDRFSPDGLAASGFDSRTYRVSPRYNFLLGGYGTWRGAFDWTRVENDRADVTSTDSYGMNLQLDSGPRFNPLTWSFGYVGRKNENSNRGDDEFQQFNYSLRYRVFSDYVLTANGGYSGNKTDGDDVVGSRDGSFFRVGLAWVPTRLTSIGGSIGRDSWNLFARWNPTNRLRFSGNYGKNDGRAFWNLVGNWRPTGRAELELGYRQNELGLSTEDQWNGLIRWRHRRTSFEGRYEQTTTTPQEIQAQPGFLTDPDTGRPILDEDGQPVIGPVFGSFTGGVFVRKRSEVSITRTARRSTYGLTGFYEQRDFQDSVDDSDSRGMRASWTWQMSGKLTSLLIANWSKESFDDDGRDDDIIFASWRLTYRASRRVSSSMTLRHNERRSNLNSFEYKENAVLLFMNITLGPTL